MDSKPQVTKEQPTKQETPVTKPEEKKETGSPQIQTTTTTQAKPEEKKEVSTGIKTEAVAEPILKTTVVAAQKIVSMLLSRWWVNSLNLGRGRKNK